MIDRREARKLAQTHLDGYSLGAVIVEAREEDFGWVFFYQSAEHLLTGDPAEMLAGNAPIVVLRDGQVHELGTAHPVEHYLARFREP